MIFITLEHILAHTSFFLLFFVTFIYWGQFFYINNTKIILLRKISMKIAYFCITSFLVIRWVYSGHFPLSNLYESCMFLSWSFTLIHLILETKSKNTWLSIITVPSAMLAHGFATLSLPKEMQESVFLVPALQSHWLMMHVTMMILSYSTLLCGSLLAITLLIITITKQKNFPIFNSFLFLIFLQPIENEIFSYKSEKIICFINFRKWQLIKELDSWSYRVISLGFPLLTIGILSGAVWANEAWGSYWNWDPKETWALITWLIFAIYLHTRMIKGWQGKKPAIIASLGFFIVWVCYLGVNLLGKGLHSYGWLV
uniref:Cytochrome c biogenesis protein CcsA n=1 Tax=Sphaerocarpos texanus TaxID=37410 RepID=A0A8F8SN15_9MARC|nr:cytochrome c biogenesis protein [Sphaerocarpos texanus]